MVLLSGHGNGAEDWMLILDPDDPIQDTPGDDLSAGFGMLIESDDVSAAPEDTDHSTAEARSASTGSYEEVPG